MTNLFLLSAPQRPRPLVRALGVALLATAGLTAQAQGLKAAPAASPLPGSPSRPATPTYSVPAAGTAAPAKTQQADFIVAVVNSEPITNNEVRTRLIRAEQRLFQQGTAPPRNELLREILDRLITERAQLQLARNLGVRADDNAVDQAVLGIARQNQVSMEELQRRLAADGIALKQFRENIRDELTLARLREREVESRVKISEQDIDQFLREQQTSEPASEQLNIAQILVAVPENATPAQVNTLRAKAERALERARAGADFGQLASELSDSPDRQAGGQLGLRTPDRLPPLFVDATRGVAVGGVVGLVKSGAGFHVLKVVEKRRSSPGVVTVTQTRARHILLRTGPELSEQAAKARLAEFKRRITSGQASFEALAKEHSQDGSANDGGDLGWASPGMFVPEFEQVMNGLAPGKVADPLVSRFGVHLIEVVERRQSQLSVREQREAVRNVLREKKMEEDYATWVQDVRGRAYVELRESPQ